ncbi:hypothetical protein [Zhongshania borealis]|uniref:DUF2283 domain-containing protein n=1 Tax=Zhongshania borealis TaxID=889488 RepID=A0ABP7X8G4_9GAMM
MARFVIVDDHGDLDIYSSIEDARADLEVIDVENSEYVIYDDLGNLIEAEIELSRGEKRFGSTKIITFISTEVNEADNLMLIIQQYLMKVGSIPLDSSFPLHELVFRLAKFQGLTEKELDE